MKVSILILLIIVYFSPFTASVSTWEELKQKYKSWMTHETYDGKWPPKFCKKLQCPMFKVLNETKDYQFREYEPSSWAMTKIDDKNYHRGMRKMFWRLYKFITGENSQYKTIEMTVPVITIFKPEPKSQRDSVITMLFYMGIKDIPKPTNSAIQIISIPKTRVYIRSFPGYVISLHSWIKEAQKLIRALNNTSLYDSSRWYTAAYNGPLEIFKRHNEIGLFAK